MLTPGKMDDRKSLCNKFFIERLFVRLVSDEDYICKGLISKLFVQYIQLVTKIKSNMNGQTMTISEKIHLRKNALIEIINDELKNMAKIDLNCVSQYADVVIQLFPFSYNSPNSRK